MIRILVDSGSEYLPEEAQAKGIEVLPIVTNVGGNDYRDGIDLGRDEFFELLEETGLFPTTSQITLIRLQKNLRKRVMQGMR